jgi:hypothetical protein
MQPKLTDCREYGIRGPIEEARSTKFAAFKRLPKIVLSDPATVIAGVANGNIPKPDVVFLGWDATGNTNHKPNANITKRSEQVDSDRGRRRISDRSRTGGSYCDAMICYLP